MNLKSDFCLYFETEGVANSNIVGIEGGWRSKWSFVV